LIFLVFGEKFPLEDLGFSRSTLASQQLSGVVKIHGRPVFFALSCFAKDMECWNFGIMAIKLLAQHSYILSFQLFLLNFCIISSSVKGFPDKGKEISTSQKVKSSYLKRATIV
jgi:hypothetical protein